MTASLNPRIETVTDQLHVLPVSLLETHAERMDEFQAISEKLRVRFGWHYRLDLAWCAQKLLDVAGPGATILDAGAGIGMMQWWLAGRGAEVVSVDRVPRTFSVRMLRWCPVVQYGTSNAMTPRRQLLQDFAAAARRPRTGARRLSGSLRGIFAAELSTHRGGVVRVLEGDLMNLKEIESESMDAVVSISSLEHNSPENLERIVPELMRVLRPGGKLVATLGAARDADWYHEPSSGWCYTEQTLRRIFDLPADAPSNYADYDALFDQLVHCDYLRENLSDLYFRSGNNGMPWGRWEPQYQSVGVVKTKLA